MGYSTSPSMDMLPIICILFVLTVKVAAVPGDPGGKNDNLKCSDEQVVRCATILSGEIMLCAEDGYQGIELANCVENMIGGCYECIPCYTCLCQIIQWLGLGNCEEVMFVAADFDFDR